MYSIMVKEIVAFKTKEEADAWILQEGHDHSCSEYMEMTKKEKASAKRMFKKEPYLRGRKWVRVCEWK